MINPFQTIPPPTSSRVRVMVVAVAALCGLIGWIVTREATDASAQIGTAAIVCWALGGAVLLVGLAWPRGVYWLYWAWMGVGAVIGFAVSRTMLAFIYFLVFMPVGLAMRVIGRDALRRRFPAESARATLWDAYPQDPRGKRRYHSLFAVERTIDPVPPPKPGP